MSRGGLLDGIESVLSNVRGRIKSALNDELDWQFDQARMSVKAEARVLDVLPNPRDAA
jgi:hypothetical protein